MEPHLTPEHYVYIAYATTFVIAAALLVAEIDPKPPKYIRPGLAILTLVGATLCTWGPPAWIIGRTVSQPFIPLEFPYVEQGPVNALRLLPVVTGIVFLFGIWSLFGARLLGFRRP